MVHVSIMQHPKNEYLLESLTEIVCVCIYYITHVHVNIGPMGQAFKKRHNFAGVSSKILPQRMLFRPTFLNLFRHKTVQTVPCHLWAKQSFLAVSKVLAEQKAHMKFIPLMSTKNGVSS